jgi:hypothetical protein
MSTIKTPPPKPLKKSRSKGQLTAAMAHEITVKQLAGPGIKPWIEYILRLIQIQAKSSFSLKQPFLDRKEDYRVAPAAPSPEMQKAIKERMEGLGYTWTGDGTSAEISWNEPRTEAPAPAPPAQPPQ